MAGRHRDESEHRRLRRLRREQPLSRLLPNLITIAGRCCGLSAVRYSLDAKWEIAVGFILAAALLDGMDGRIARLLGATSIFGAQLDSFADFVSFGVSPALVMYFWQLRFVHGLGWAAVLFYAVCCALRLARFNTGILQDNQASWQKKFFTGIPSPAGGLLCMLPLIATLRAESDLSIPPMLTVCYVALIAGLMVSRLPTFAAKHIHIKPELILPVMVAGVLLVVFFISDPWGMLCALGIGYLAAIPLSVRHYRKLRLKNATV